MKTFARVAFVAFLVWLILGLLYGRVLPRLRRRGRRDRERLEMVKAARDWKGNEPFG